MCTFNLLQGGPYIRSLTWAVVLVEDDDLTNPVEFARDLTCYCNSPTPPTWQPSSSAPSNATAASAG